MATTSCSTKSSGSSSQLWRLLRARTGALSRSLRAAPGPGPPGPPHSDRTRPRLRQRKRDDARQRTDQQFRCAQKRLRGQRVPHRRASSGRIWRARKLSPKRPANTARQQFIQASSRASPSASTAHRVGGTRLRDIVPEGNSSERERRAARPMTERRCRAGAPQQVDAHPPATERRRRGSPGVPEGLLHAGDEQKDALAAAEEDQPAPAEVRKVPSGGQQAPRAARVTAACCDGPQASRAEQARFVLRDALAAENCGRIPGSGRRLRGLRGSSSVG